MQPFIYAYQRLKLELYTDETLMIASNTQENGYTFEMDLCIGAWLNGCMRNDSKRLVISIHTTAFKFVTCNPVKSRASIQTCIHTQPRRGLET